MLPSSGPAPARKARKAWVGAGKTRTLENKAQRPALVRKKCEAGRVALLDRFELSRGHARRAKALASSIVRDSGGW